VDSGQPIGGPLGKLLANSTDLGPSQGHAIQITVTLRDSTRPAALLEWAAQHQLSVRWRDGDTFAYVAGAPAAFGNAFGVSVHDFRSPDGQLYYASRCQPDIPAPVRGEVTGLGRILSYDSVHRA